jgi:hypothetical protein
MTGKTTTQAKTNQARKKNDSPDPGDNYDDPAKMKDQIEKLAKNLLTARLIAKKRRRRRGPRRHHRPGAGQARFCPAEPPR